MRKFLVFLTFFVCSNGESQTLHGKLADSLGIGIQGAIVTLSDISKKKMISFGMSDVQGRFLLNIRDSGTLLLTIRHVGYLEKIIEVKLGESDLKVITLFPSTKMMEEIVIRSDLPIQIKGDTTTFNIQKLLSPEDKRLEDVFSKLPGFKVDPSGRLSFKGKMVEKLFIDGDDPAGFNYGLITKNLSPKGVDKIDVVEDFSEDRLMKKAKRSDVVGVNIRMKSDYQMKLTGNVELGLSDGKKRAAQISANILGKKIKSLNFSSANNSGESLGENYSGRVYRSREELLAEALESEDEIQMVGSVNILAPNIDERIILHNNDFGATSLMSWRLGSFTKMNGQFGFVNTSQWVKKDNWSITNLPGAISWEIFENELLQNNEKKMFSAFSFKKDKGKNTTSKGHLMLSGANLSQKHINKMTGGVKDSMYGKINGKQWLYDANWSKTFLSGKNVIRIALLSEQQDGQQFFITNTKRLYNYFKIDPTFSYYLQTSTKKINSNSAEIRVNQKKKNISFEYGWRAKFLKNISGFEQTAKSNNSSTKSLNESDLNVSLLTSSFHGNLEIESNKKWGFELKSKVGVGKLIRNKVESSLPDLSTDLKINRKLGRNETVMLGYEWYRSFSDWVYFVPDKILSSNASIKRILDYSGPSAKHSINASLYSFNILRQRNFIVLFEYTQNKNIYNSTTYTYPEYSENGLERFRNNPEFRIMLSQDKYVRLLKSTIQVGLNWFDQKGSMRLNGKFAEQKSKTGGFNWSFNTGFDFPINGEFGGQINYVEYNWNGEGPSVNWQKSWKSKIRWKVNKNGYMAGRWKWYQLAPKEGFSSVDFYTTWNIKKSVELNMEAINLLNASTLKTRTVNAYSESNSSLELNKRFFLMTLVCFF